MAETEAVIGEDERVFLRPFMDEVLRPDWVHPETFGGGSGFSIDSRTLAPGEIFVALRTARRDGHDFLGAAEEKGAAAAIVAVPRANLSLPQIVVGDPLRALQALGAAWRRHWGGRVIGVTGSCGKTSTKEMLGLLLGRKDTLVTPHNQNNFIGVPLSELLLRPPHRRAVLEAGISEGGEMELLASLLEPEVAVVTTIGPAHLEMLGSIEGVAREKSVLPRHASEKVFLGPACADYEAFTGADFPGANWLLPRSRADFCPRGGARLWTYGLEPTGAGRGCRVRLHGGGDLFVFQAPEITPGMIENTCLAIMVAQSEGVAEELIRERLAHWRPTARRGEVIEVGGRVVYADHYNANPASFADAASYFHRRFPEAPRIWVIGGMEELGRDSAAWHRKLAAGLPVLAGDRVFLIGGMSGEMLSTLRQKVGEGHPVTFCAEVEEALEDIAGTEGVIFLKGSRKYRLEKILDSIGGSA